MLQQDKPDDYVLATGETHSVREFVELAFAETGRKIAWQGAGTQEHGVDAKSGQVLVSSRSALFPPDRGGSLAGRSRPRRGPSSAGSTRRASASWWPRWSQPIW